MNKETTNRLLTRLLVIHNRSLPTYLKDASPWWESRDGKAAEVLEQVIRDQHQMTNRLGSLIVANGGDVDLGEFPMLFTAFHDLSGNFLLAQMIQYQQRSVDAIARCVEPLGHDPRAQGLAQEALGMAKAHLDMMRQLAETPAGSAS